MIVEGMKLTLLGIGVVYLFLSLLVVVIKLSSRILRPLTAKEEAKYNAVPAKKIVNRRAEDEQQRIMAVINAAIAAHRVRKALAKTWADEELQPADSQPTPAIVPNIPSAGLQRSPKVPTRAGRGPGALFFKDRSSLRGFFHTQ